ncbi:hypothetical protein [Kribbella sp. NPDC048915]|uniref:hypothetical protein n=1 Tax=Kribbella sp. NPDC048915 TaxID=3155148 RepID=UPI0033CDA107
MRRSSWRQRLVSVAAMLLVVVTGLGLITMPGVVGVEWPGWTSLMFLVAVLVIPAAWVLLGISTGTATFARWIAVFGVGVVAARIAWSTYDAGPAVLLAVLPLLATIVLLGVVIAYSWPRATTRAIRDAAQRNGWRVVDPRELRLPQLPLPVGRTWSARNVVQTPQGIAFEVQWLRWHGLLCRRDRLSAFVTTLPVALPPLQVQPGGLTRSDVTLESGEFNRSFDVIGDEPRYLTAVLHPRTMQTLLDLRPIALAVASSALVLSRSQPLTPGLLTEGITALDRVKIPQYVYDDYGRYAPEPSPGLRFQGRRFDPSPTATLLRMTTLATGLLGSTLLTCLAAAATQSDFDPPNPVAKIVAGGAVLLAISVGCALARKVYGSAMA